MTEIGPNRDLVERTYKFAEFEVRVASGELMQGDRRIEVAPKVFEMFFVRNPGRLVTNAQNRGVMHWDNRGAPPIRL